MSRLFTFKKLNIMGMMVLHFVAKELSFVAVQSSEFQNAMEITLFCYKIISASHKGKWPYVIFNPTVSGSLIFFSCKDAHCQPDCKKHSGEQYRGTTAIISPDLWQSLAS